jgi:hypothetical protein
MLVLSMQHQLMQADRQHGLQQDKGAAPQVTAKGLG